MDLPQRSDEEKAKIVEGFNNSLDRYTKSLQALSDECQNLIVVLGEADNKSSSKVAKQVISDAAGTFQNLTDLFTKVINKIQSTNFVFTDSVNGSELEKSNDFFNHLIDFKEIVKAIGLYSEITTLSITVTNTFVNMQGSENPREFNEFEQGELIGLSVYPTNSKERAIFEGYSSCRKIMGIQNATTKHLNSLMATAEAEYSSFNDFISRLFE